MFQPLRYQFTGEDHTLGNALRYMLMKDPDVEFAGYTAPVLHQGRGGLAENAASHSTLSTANAHVAAQLLTKIHPKPQALSPKP